MTRTFELTLHYPAGEDVLEVPTAAAIRAWLLEALSRSRCDRPLAVVVESAESEES